MSREVRIDFKELTSFIENYSLPSKEGEPNYYHQIARLHKVYYSLLTLHRDVCQTTESGKPTSTLDLYLNEVISELGSSFFVFLHGCYKASHLILRSAIENFCKAFGSEVSPNITELKHTYEVIAQAGQASVFQNSDNRKLFETLKEEYSQLCATVHTASSDKMQNVTALGYFPHYDKNSSSSFANQYLKIAKTILEVVCHEYRDKYLGMHYKNRDIVDASLSPTALKKLNTS